MMLMSERHNGTLWDTVDGRVIAQTSEMLSVLNAAFSPDGTRLVTTAERDDVARLWDAADGREIAVLKGHTGAVLRAAFSPDGALVVTASEDKTARLWDAANGHEIAVLKGHTGYVWHAAFSPDGTRLVTASTDGTARIWWIGPWTSVASLIDNGTARVPRCLSEYERQDVFLADQPPAWCYVLAKPPYRPLRFGFTHARVDMARAKRLHLANREGSVVNRVLKDQPADAAGLRVDDIVLAADGSAVGSPGSLDAVLDRVPAGGSIRLTVLRAGQRLEIDLKPAF
jgi:hypothetical protein